MVKQKKNIQETTSEFEPIAIERAAHEDDIRPILEDIKNCDEVIGYILRNTTSAAIDLKDPTKVIDYATLSSAAFDAAEQLSELFDLGKVKNIIVEGKDTKTLHLRIGENNISIFMEKSADTKKILEQMHVQ
jgi:predicted regulator of Ras-like GTPase activity (Roadblock/LC7/MglB family)